MAFRPFFVMLVGTLVVASMFAFVVPQAQAGLVPCGASEDDPSTSTIDESFPCRPCDLFILGHNVFTFLVVQVALPLTVLVIIISGVMMMFAGGFPGTGQNPGLKTKAKAMLQTAILGLLIILMSWVIVNTTIVWLTGSQQPGGFPWPWHTPQCAARPPCYTMCLNNCLGQGIDVGLCRVSCDIQCD